MTDTKGCQVDGCDRRFYGRGYCNLHYLRWKRGSALAAPIRAQSIHQCSVPGTAHARVTREFGPAKLHKCIQCGNQAKDWAYDGTDPTQLYGQDSAHNSKVWYSRYPEFYMPMCRQCHLRRDGGRFSAELEEYRTLKVESGLTYEEIRQRCLT